MKDTKTYVSIDLCNDYTQMAYYVTNDMEVSGSNSCFEKK